MRAAPGPIPATMPDTDKVLRNLIHLVDKPRAHLCDLSVSQLVDMYANGPTWLTGSTVWLPAVFDIVEYDTDFDIVLATKEAAQKFIDGVLGELNRRIPDGYHLGRSRFGSGRIEKSERIIAPAPVDNNTWRTPVLAGLEPAPYFKPIIDIWALDGDESIAELLMSYPHDYHRAAFYMGFGAPQAAALTRIVKLRQRLDTNINTNMFREIRRATNVY